MPNQKKNWNILMKKLKFDKKSQNENGYPWPSLCFHDLHLIIFW